MENFRYKVIIYGISETRAEIEAYLSESYEIIAYSDSFYNNDEFEYKPFIQPNKLNNINFDYIIIATSNEQTNNIIYRKILEFGIPENKIIQYFYFAFYRGGIDYLNPLADYKNINKHFDGFVLGMSHSVRAFSSNYFTKKFYKFSSRGMDLYYQNLVIKNVFETKSFLLDKLESIVLELPYYIFNYDVSKAPDAFKTVINYYEPFNDYHNFGKTPSEARYIDEYIIFKDMFYKRRCRNTSSWSNNHETESIEYISSEKIKEGILKLSHVWTKKHPETVQENIKIFENILNLIKQFNSSIKIIISVFPHSSYEIDYHRTYIIEMKENFYKIINQYRDEYELKVFDHFDLFYKNELYFVDIVHMNALGSKVYSKILNRCFEDEIYQ